MENKKYKFKYLKSDKNLYAYASGYIIAVQFKDNKWAVADKDYFLIKQAEEAEKLQVISKEEAMAITNNVSPNKYFGDIVAVYYKNTNDFSM